jgi:hypothetical protein
MKSAKKPLFDAPIESKEDERLSGGNMEPALGRMSHESDLGTPAVRSRTSSVAMPNSAERMKVTQDNEDPLSPAADFTSNSSVTTESLVIKLADEVRIVAAMANAAKRQTTGSLFNVKVELSKSGALGIGVKDLSGNLLAVSMLKRTNGHLGAGESAGVRLGDIIFGVNFAPTREGSRTMQQVLLRENYKNKKSIHLQCWRCHQLCADPPPGSLFPKEDDVIVQAHNLYRTKVFSDWERWNFIDVLLRHMLEDMKLRSSINAKMKANMNSAADTMRAARTLRALDLERSISQAKGLRRALCVRIVHTKTHEDTAYYVLRVEDVETGLQWVVHRRYRDFSALQSELNDTSPYCKDIKFPHRHITLQLRTDKLVESRIMLLEQYVRRVLHVLSTYAAMDPAASKSLRHVQTFLGVNKYINPVHPPLMDDQRFIELMAFKFLNDFNSPACQQCVRFVTNVDLHSLVVAQDDTGYSPVLTHVSLALAEVEAFVLQSHQKQLESSLIDRNPSMESDQARNFVRRCVRRQVEAAIYLPLRRSVFKIIYPFISEKAQQMQQSLYILQHAPPSFFNVDPLMPHAGGFTKAIKAFRDVIHAYLPSDQGQLLMHAAAAVMDLYAECMEMRKHFDQTAERRQSESSGGSRNSDGKRVRLGSIRARTRSDPSSSSRGSSKDLSAANGTKSQSIFDRFFERKRTKTIGNHREGKKGGRPSVFGSLATSITDALNSEKDGSASRSLNSPRVDPQPERSLSATVMDYLDEEGLNESVKKHEVKVDGKRRPESDYDLLASSAAPMDEPTRQKSRSFESQVLKDLIGESDDFLGKDDKRKSNLLDLLDEEGAEDTGRPRQHTDSLFDDVKALRQEMGVSTDEDDKTARLRRNSAINMTPFQDPDEVATEKNGHERNGMDGAVNGSDQGRPSSALKTSSNKVTNASSEVSLETLSLTSNCTNADGSANPLPKRVMFELEAEEDEDEEEGPSAPGNGSKASSSSSSSSLPPTQPPIDASVDDDLPQLDDRHTESPRNNGAESAILDCLPTISNPKSGDGSRDVHESEPRGPEYDALDVQAEGSTQVQHFSSDRNILSVSIDEKTGSKRASLERVKTQEVRFDVLIDSNMLSFLYFHFMFIPCTRISFYMLTCTLISNCIYLYIYAQNEEKKTTFISADDFLPLFTYVLVQADMPQLILVKELMNTLVDDEETYGECGYYLTTLEAAVQYVSDLADQFQNGTAHRDNNDDDDDENQ